MFSQIPVAIACKIWITIILALFISIFIFWSFLQQCPISGWYLKSPGEIMKEETKLIFHHSTVLWPCAQRLCSIVNNVLDVMFFPSILYRVPFMGAVLKMKLLYCRNEWNEWKLNKRRKHCCSSFPFWKHHSPKCPYGWRAIITFQLFFSLS